VSPRLDQVLLKRGLVRSRNQGREFILSGQVLLDGVACRRPSQPVSDASRIEIDEGAHRHRVGRGYDKLGRFLSLHPVEFEGRFVVDGGASTGGFTQQALERGASRVVAIELGRDQLDGELRSSPRVESCEHCDLLGVEDLDAPCEILLLDLSFISLKRVLPSIRLPFARKARIIALVKPQFEAESRELTAAGRLRNPARAEAILESVLDCARDCGWTILAKEPVEPGPDQKNREFFFLAHRELGGAE